MNVEKRQECKQLVEKDFNITDEALELLEKINDANTYFLNSEIIRQDQKRNSYWKMFTL